MRDPSSNPAARRRRRAATALILALACLAPAACGSDEETAGTTAVSTTTASTTTIPDPGPRIEEAPKGGARKAGKHGGKATQEEEEGVSGATPAEADPSAPSDVDAAERRQVAAAEDVYADYVRAINARDGAELCRVLDPSFADELELPVTRGSCAQRLTGSIGYADPRGTPVWRKTILSSVESALLRKGARVQLSVAIVTQFRNRDQASVESDIAYLAPSSSGYVLAKAPGSLWRAVGKPDVPPTVITPPPGF